ncbi:MAG: 30S ribosomal protein S20 [Deltaproteobacteria bacterium]|nr:MAG: 30S ribosomal protein S20 [Deltaproteobacteria bacterium]
MATHASALKRHRQSLKRRARNRMHRSAMKTQIKHLMKAIETNDPQKAQEELRKTVKKIAKTSAKGVLHWKTAARKISRLTRRVDAMQSQAKGTAEA